MSERFAWIYDPVAGVKRWCADMWSRRHILNLQNAVSDKQDALTTAQLAAVNSGISASDLAINDASVLRTVTQIVPTLINGNPYPSYGNTYYYKIGCRVHVHVGIRDLTAGTTYTLWTMPEGYRPGALASAVGIGGNISTISRLRISTAGLVQVNTDHTAAGIDMEYDAFS